MKKTFYIARDNNVRSYPEVFTKKPRCIEGYWAHPEINSFDWICDWPRLKPGQIVKIRMEVVR